MTIKTASTIHTLQGMTAVPGLIVIGNVHVSSRKSCGGWPHTWSCPGPLSLAQLISVGIPDDLRDIIQGGPPESILSRFNDMFKEKEDATHIRAAEVMREFGWDATD